jgi:hypothetical protein
MMSKRRSEADDLTVLRISTQVLGINGVVLTDCNAGSNYVRFLAPTQWQLLEFDDILARDWRHPNNPPRFYQHRSRKCAEVLVPDRVESRYIIGAYVVDITAAKRLSAQEFALPVAIDSDLFFR